jgi:tetratricopeptide (TPR) repeat protein
LGYLNYLSKNYKEALKHFNAAIELRPDNCYAYAKLSWTYTGLFLKASKIDPRRSGYRQKAKAMYAMASGVSTPDLRRIKWLERYLRKNGIIN